MIRPDLKIKSDIPLYDKIVVGSTLTAVLYAFVHRMPIFFTQAVRPFRFDYLSCDVDLKLLSLPQTPKSLTTVDTTRSVGIAKELLWERLLFLLSLDGKAPLSNLCHTMRYDGTRVTCSNEYSKIMEFKFNECHYFGDDGTIGFAKQKELDEDMYICYDYIAFNRGGKHEVDYISTDDDFVREIWFYSSDRIDGNTAVRDACAVSILTPEQLLDFDFSQTMARFKLIYEMESRGMKGLFNGYTAGGHPKHYKFRTTSIQRTTHKRRNREHSECPHVKIATPCEESLLEALPQACVAYDRFLRHR
tara:strand:- start:610 stop:1521 length:912 start_codon:yes stop_codon:yes gene_type:complete